MKVRFFKGGFRVLIFHPIPTLSFVQGEEFFRKFETKKSCCGLKVANTEGEGKEKE